MNVALLGATGAMGQRFVKMLERHPYFDLQVLVASSQRKGEKYGKSVHWLLGDEVPDYVRDLELQPFRHKIFEDVDIIFSALPSDVARKYEGVLREMGFAVFTNASAYRMARDVPIVIPEVNGEHMNLITVQRGKYGGFIVTNSNCSTSGLVMALHPLRRFGIEDVFVSTYQAISGAGYPGLASLDILGNAVPYIAGEEDKMKRETRKILGKYTAVGIKEYNLNLVANCVRVPVRDGHLESVVVKLTEDVDIEEIKREMKGMNGIEELPTAPPKPLIIRDEENRPQPALDAYAGSGRTRGMSVVVGRFAKFQNYIRFFLLVHNTIRGGAGNAILSAEYALKNGFL